MKQFLFLFAALSAVCCSPDEPSEDERILEMVKTNIEANSIMTDHAFDRTREILGDQESLRTQIGLYQTRQPFITKMKDLTKDVIDFAIEQTVIARALPASAPYTITIDTRTPSIEFYLAQLATGIEGPTPGSGVLDKYSQQVDDSLALKHGEQILIETFSFGGGSSNDQPQSQFSLNFAQIKDAKESIEDLILQFEDEHDLDSAITEFINENKESAILIGLLLPAIQKVRYHPTGAKTSYQKLNDLIFGAAMTTERKQWDQKMRRAAFLDAVAILISKDYNNRDENFASFCPQVGVYRAVTVLVWARAYDQYN